ncbi:MAG: hypothetical protein ABFD75_12370 [Smithella sp.]
MTTLNLPVLSRGNATECNFSLQPNTQSFESPLNKTVQTYELPGAKWLFTATWQNLNQADARIFKAWLASLRGMAGRFYANDLAHKTPSGCISGTLSVNAAAAAGASAISALSSLISTSNILLPGDYFQVGTELKIVTAAASTNGSGVAAISFEPPLRTALTGTESITYNTPLAIFRLNDDKQDNFNFDPERRPSITLSSTEVFS